MNATVRVLGLTNDEEVRTAAGLSRLRDLLQAQCPNDEILGLTSLQLSESPGRLLNTIGAGERRGERPGTLVTVTTTAGSLQTVRAALADRVPSLWSATTHHILEPVTGASSGGVWRIALARRIPHMTATEFREHYLGHHVPLVMGLGPLFDHYVVNLVDDGPWDSVTEQRFADTQVWSEHDRQIQEEKPAVMADLPRFLGHVTEFRGDHRVDVGPA